MAQQSSGVSRGTSALPSPIALEQAARRAFAEVVRYYERDDEVIVHAEPFHLRLIYFNRRASCEHSRATFVQCRMEDGEDAVWISTLQVAPDLQRQGLGSDMVSAVEVVAQSIGRSKLVVYPLLTAVGFWQSLGFVPHPNISRVLQKTIP